LLEVAYGLKSIVAFVFCSTTALYSKPPENSGDYRSSTDCIEIDHHLAQWPSRETAKRRVYVRQEERYAQNRLRVLKRRYEGAMHDTDIRLLAGTLGVDMGRWGANAVHAKRSAFDDTPPPCGSHSSCTFILFNQTLYVISEKFCR
jgi:hypothetical protein